jgi:hypothetical protein
MKLVRPFAMLLFGIVFWFAVLSPKHLESQATWIRTSSRLVGSSMAISSQDASRLVTDPTPCTVHHVPWTCCGKRERSKHASASSTETQPKLETAKSAFVVQTLGLFPSSSKPRLLCARRNDLANDFVNETTSRSELFLRVACPTLFKHFVRTASFNTDYNMRTMHVHRPSRGKAYIHSVPNTIFWR